MEVFYQIGNKSGGLISPPEVFYLLLYLGAPFLENIGETHFLPQEVGAIKAPHLGGLPVDPPGGRREPLPHEARVANHADEPADRTAARANGLVKQRRQFSRELLGDSVPRVHIHVVADPVAIL